MENSIPELLFTSSHDAQGRLCRHLREVAKAFKDPDDARLKLSAPRNA